MSDLLTRLAARALGRVPLATPRVGPRFAPEPRLPVEPASSDSPDEGSADELATPDQPRDPALPG